MTINNPRDFKVPKTTEKPQEGGNDPGEKMGTHGERHYKPLPIRGGQQGYHIFRIQPVVRRDHQSIKSHILR